MRNIIVDTSVAIKWYYEIGEPDYKKARIIIRLLEVNEISLVAPQIVLLELANVIKFGKKSDQQKCLKILSSFQYLIDNFIELPEINFVVNEIYSNNITSYDATFIALAQKLDLPLITADYKHHHKSISPHIIHLKDWNGKI